MASFLDGVQLPQGQSHFEEATIHPIKPSAAFRIKTSHLIFCVNQRTAFYMKCNIEVK